MTVNLRKGEKINLKKEDVGLRAVMVGLGWDEARRRGLFGLKKPQPIDCDASVILCGADGRVVSPELNRSVIYFDNLRHPSDAIIHQGDNLTGEGEGDDEQIFVNLQRVPPEIEKLVFAVNIYDADKRGQHFGMIKNAFIRLVDVYGRKEFCRFDLSENYEGMTGLIVGEIYRRGSGWQFNAIGQPVREASRLQALVDLYR